ncbi:MAG: trypsin-like peptidase domain-containing protein [Alphaproteobacteria bacterium]|nr:trypsin-like peptidase domain-containing protein [Alphaproteobacteria bacterium]
MRSSPLTLLLLLLGALLLSPHVSEAADRRTPVVMAVEKALPSVVSIETEVLLNSPFARLAGLPAETTAQGSGVIIAADGVVLTNAHVVARANNITVHTSDGRRWPATVVGLDTDLDLAVLRLQDAKGLPTATIGRSSELMLGETVIAIGNPYGLGQTVSTGVVSTVEREVEITPGIYQRYIQTDAAINPGNSGGALVNLDGELIGVNTAIRQGAQGIGFSIPVDRAFKVAQDMLTFGSVRAPWLGLDIRDISRTRLAGTPLAEGAVLVSKVYPGGPADKAGLKPGDLVHQVDGRAARSLIDINAYLAGLKPGAKVELSFYRGADPLKVKLSTTEFPTELVTGVLSDVLGVTVKTNAAGGVVVTAVNTTGSWTKAGLMAGDIIVAVNGQPVRTPEQLSEALSLAKSQHRSSAMFTVVRARYRGNFTLEI